MAIEYTSFFNSKALQNIPSGNKLHYVTYPPHLRSQCHFNFGGTILTPVLLMKSNFMIVLY
jgi:hypothetical protein